MGRKIGWTGWPAGNHHSLSSSPPLLTPTTHPHHSPSLTHFIIIAQVEVNSLKAGLPWEEGVLITPLPEPHKPAYLEELINDAGCC
jgi:hypothetical protein